MTLRLPTSMREEMIAQAVEELPNECCGIILGKDGAAVELRRTRNAEASQFRYVIDPRGDRRRPSKPGSAAQHVGSRTCSGCTSRICGCRRGGGTV